MDVESKRKLEKQILEELAIAHEKYHEYCNDAVHRYKPAGNHVCMSILQQTHEELQRRMK